MVQLWQNEAQRWDSKAQPWLKVRESKANSSNFFRIRNVRFNSNPQSGERFSESMRKGSLENREGSQTIPLSSRGYDQPSLPEIGWLQLGDRLLSLCPFSPELRCPYREGWLVSWLRVLMWEAARTMVQSFLG